MAQVKAGAIEIDYPSVAHILYFLFHFVIIYIPTDDPHPCSPLWVRLSLEGSGIRLHARP